MFVFESTRNTRPILDGSIKYIRSDVPIVVTESEKEWMISNNITTIVDLRSEEEKIKKPCGLMCDERFDYRSYPLRGGDRIPESPRKVAESYIGMADDRFNDLVDFLLNASTNVLYFCNAGKDRTGVLSAALLCRLGKSRECIISDYMKSKDNLIGMLTSFANQNPEVDIDVITPHEEYISDFLDWYSTDHKK